MKYCETAKIKDRVKLLIAPEGLKYLKMVCYTDTATLLIAPEGIE
jgi:hypothetical protein